MAHGGFGPKCHAGPPLKRSRTLPSVRNTADIGGLAAKARPSVSTKSAPLSMDATARFLGQAPNAPSSRSQAAISAPVHGRGSTAAQGRAAASTQVRSKIQSPAPTSFAAAEAATGNHASAAQSAKPPASSGPDSGTRMTFANGPTSEARPNTASHSGHSAAAMAALIKNKAAAARTNLGQPAGVTRCAALPAQMIAAQAPTLMTALGESADAGSMRSMTAAAHVSAADAVVSRPRTHPESAAASITQARTHGGSAPVISV